MRCPKCPGILKDITIEGIAVDVCWICEGIWFDKGEMEKVISRDTGHLRLSHLDQPEMDGAEILRLRKQVNDKIGQCPRCKEKVQLEKRPYPFNPKLEIDMCPHGHGVWLDGGEVQLLRDKTLAKIVRKWDDFKEWMSDAFHGRVRGL